jgi:hypothetical protein
MEFGIEIIDEIHAAHDDIGIGNPHYVDHAKNQIESEGEQREYAAEQDAVDDRFEKIDVHLFYGLICLNDRVF